MSNQLKIIKKMGIGIHELPAGIQNSKVLTSSDLALLASVPELPVIDVSFTNDTLKNIVQYYAINPADMDDELHMYAQKLLAESKLYEAWQVLLSAEPL